MTDFASLSPVEIDTQLAKLYHEQAVATARCEQLRAIADNYADQPRQQAFYDNKANDESAKIDALRAEITPLDAEFVARGGWTRYWLVTNSNGHLHNTTHCNTCFPNTSFAWLTQYSGTSHEDLVELAGEKACTVCFPDAPVDTLKRASRLSTPEQEARKAEKTQKAQAAVEAQLVVPDYADQRRDDSLVVKGKTFKTVRGATNEIASNLNDLVFYGTSHPTAPLWVHNTQAIRVALAAKGVEFDYDKALATARKKLASECKKYGTVREAKY